MKKLFLMILMVLLSATATLAQVNVQTTILGPSLWGDLYTNTLQPIPYGQERPGCNSAQNLYHGFRFLSCPRWPWRNLASGNILNWEFHLDGVRTDDCPSFLFLPRLDYCQLKEKSLTGATLFWPNEYESFGMDVSQRYQATPLGIDLTFTVTPKQKVPDCGWQGFFFASYLIGAIGRKIYFYGAELDPTGDNGDNQHVPVVLKTGWVHLGDGDPADPSDFLNYGIVPKLGVPYLRITDGKGFIAERRDIRFICPIYYGLVDGDGDLSTSNDTMVWAVMFDQDDTVRFAMYNITRDIHEPAWDYEWIIYNPIIGQNYSFRTHVVYVPFKSHEETQKFLLNEYRIWKEELG